MIAFLVFILPLTLYFARPSCLWNVDGVACAMALELGNPAFLFHSQHLLYGFLGFCFWKLLSLPLGSMRALPALQIFTSLLSAAGLLGIYACLRDESRRPWLALAVTGSMAAAAVFWVWSVEPQVYALGFLGLSWATYFLFRRETPLKWEAVGLWHALAVLGHIVNALWIVPALYWMLQDKSPDRPRRLRNYLGFLTVGVGIPYLAVLSLCVFPKHTRAFISNWLKGSAGISTDRHWAWHTTSLRAPLDWAHTTLEFFWGTFWPYGGAKNTFWIYGLTALSAAVLVGLFMSAWKSEERAARHFALLWIGVFGLFWWTWEPRTECYRMAEAVPFALLIFLGLKRMSQPKIALGIGTALTAALLAINWQTRISPMNRSENNALYEDTVALARLTPENSVYLTEGGPVWIYLLYFTGRTAWNIHVLPETQLDGWIRNHQPMLSIFVIAPILRDAPSAPWLSHYRLKPVGDDLPWMELQ